jgi:peptidoglycan/xylan/chitin deacetylase (PgdA/CDA1 family)
LGEQAADVAIDLFRIVTRAAWLAPFPLARRLAPSSAAVLGLHVVGPRLQPHQVFMRRVPDEREFERQLDFALRRYTIVDLRALIGSVAGEAPLPPRALHLTFDDGSVECGATIAPMLKRKGAPATFFVCTGVLDNLDLLYRHKASVLHDHLRRQGGAQPPAEGELADAWRRVRADPMSVSYGERHVLDRLAAVLGVDFAEYARERQPYLTTPMIREMIAAGFAVGSHSIDHPPFTAIPEPEQRRQARESLDVLCSRFGLGYRAFAFPYTEEGLPARALAALMADAGADIVFGTRGFVTDAEPRIIHRLIVDKPDGLSLREKLTKQYLRSAVLRATGRAVVRRT